VSVNSDALESAIGPMGSGAAEGVNLRIPMRGLSSQVSVTEGAPEWCNAVRKADL